MKVPATRKPLILLNVSASGHAHAPHLFTIPENGLTAMVFATRRGIEFAKLSGGVHGLCYAKRGMNVDEAPWT